jgi:hypothetical protein
LSCFRHRRRRTHLKLGYRPRRRSANRCQVSEEASREEGQLSQLREEVQRLTRDIDDLRRVAGEKPARRPDTIQTRPFPPQQPSVLLGQSRPGGELHRLVGYRTMVRGVAISRDEKLAASGDGMLRLWDLPSGQEISPRTPT